STTSRSARCAHHSPRTSGPTPRTRAPRPCCSATSCGVRGSPTRWRRSSSSSPASTPPGSRARPTRSTAGTRSRSERDAEEVALALHRSLSSEDGGADLADQRTVGSSSLTLLPSGPMRFVLVHGGFHGAWCWERTVAELHALGHDAVAIDLPG